MKELTLKLKKFKDISVKLIISGRFDDAEKMCQAALEMLEQGENCPEKNMWQSDIRTQLGTIKMAQKDFQNAVGEYLKAVESLIELPPSPKLAFAYDNLSRAMEAIGDFDSAREFKNIAKSIIAKAEPLM